MSVITDKQMKYLLYAGGALVGLIVLRSLTKDKNDNGDAVEKVAEAVGKGVVDATVGIAKGAGVAIYDTAKGTVSGVNDAIKDKVQLEFLKAVKDAGGIGLQNQYEINIALSYMPSPTSMGLTGMAMGYAYFKIKAYAAAQAVKQYRYDLIALERKTNDKQPWGVQ